jgi:hypothetical protein
MVLARGHVTDPAGRARPSERALLERAAAHLRERGYRTYVDPDGGSYFDLAAVRGDELGLVEGKVGHTRDVLGQALRRRAWADWVSVVVDVRRGAERLVARTAETRARAVGVWLVEADRLVELRAAERRSADAGPASFVELKGRLREALDAIDRGASPEGVRWAGVPSEVRRVSGGRKFAEWRLDELVD